MSILWILKDHKDIFLINFKGSLMMMEPISAQVLDTPNFLLEKRHVL